MFTNSNLYSSLGFSYFLFHHKFDSITIKAAKPKITARHTAKPTGDKNAVKIVSFKATLGNCVVVQAPSKLELESCVTPSGGCGALVTLFGVELKLCATFPGDWVVIVTPFRVELAFSARTPCDCCAFLGLARETFESLADILGECRVIAEIAF